MADRIAPESFMCDTAALMILKESCVLFFQKTRDPTLKYRMERTPFLEEQVRKLREDGKDVHLDLERLLLSEENKFDFVNEIIAEGNRCIENNPDEYVGKKAVLHALSNRLNDAGIYRPEAYYEPDPYRPPGFIRDDLKRMEKISQGRR
ncbi:protein PLASTID TRANSCRIPTIONALLY ACTIVE 7 [Rhododendron vialii]|uniref:protein PLASTID TRANSCRIPTIONALLY ACTIVE 7 n=1 Tax=Rhododendron vialii TaxID=182163 RepID=UPI00265EED19|nr:protein PLASTID TRANSCRIPTIONALLY ACTIVE 7 [Rhododendron vialii]